MYMLSLPLNTYYSSRNIHPNFILGLLFCATYPFLVKLRETKDHQFKDYLDEDTDNNLLN